MEFSTKQVIVSLKAHTLAVTALACSDSRLASGSADSTIKIWNLATNELIYTLTKHTTTVQAIAFSPNGDYLATAGSDRTIHLWFLLLGSTKALYRVILGRFRQYLLQEMAKF